MLYPSAQVKRKFDVRYVLTEQINKKFKIV